MEDSFGILHVNGTFGAIHTRNHVIRCIQRLLPLYACKLHSATCMKKSKIDFLHQYQAWMSGRHDDKIPASLVHERFQILTNHTVPCRMAKYFAKTQEGIP